MQHRQSDRKRLVLGNLVTILSTKTHWWPSSKAQTYQSTKIHLPRIQKYQRFDSSRTYPSALKDRHHNSQPLSHSTSSAQPQQRPTMPISQEQYLQMEQRPNQSKNTYKQRTTTVQPHLPPQPPLPTSQIPIPSNPPAPPTLTSPFPFPSPNPPSPKQWAAPSPNPAQNLTTASN